MGNPLISLFLEFLDSGPFKYRLPSNTTYFRYINGLLIFLPQNIIPFLDILINKSQNSLTFEIYHKPTNKNDYDHFYYRHHNKIKTGLITGFYLRALRKGSLQYLIEEFEYIEHSLKFLKYPRFFILNSRKTAFKIHSSNKPKKTNPSIPITHRPISLPTNTPNITLYYKLTKLGILIIQTISQTIKNLINITKWTSNEMTFHTGIYSIPCKDCNKHYISETQCNLEKRIYEHKQSIKTHDDQSALFSHMLELKQTFNFSQATLIQPIHCKKSRRLCSHFQNKTYKTTSRFLPNLIIPSEHHTKQNQNRKWIKKKNLHSVPPYFSESFLYYFTSSPSSSQLPPRHHNSDKFL